MTKHKNAFRHLGFHIDEEGSHSLSRKLNKDYERVLKVGIPAEYRHIPPTLAVISVRKFLERYGTRQKKGNRQGSEAAV